MGERYGAETKTEAVPDTDTNRQIAALYLRLAESIVAALKLNTPHRIRQVG